MNFLCINAAEAKKPFQFFPCACAGKCAHTIIENKPRSVRGGKGENL